jgi:hypothetical protein
MHRGRGGLRYQGGCGTCGCLHHGWCDSSGLASRIGLDHHVRFGLGTWLAGALGAQSTSAAGRFGLGLRRGCTRGEFFFLVVWQRLIRIPPGLTVGWGQFLGLLELKARRAALLWCELGPLGHSRLNALSLVTRHRRHLRCQLNPLLFLVRAYGAPVILQWRKRRTRGRWERPPLWTLLRGSSCGGWRRR